MERAIANHLDSFSHPDVLALAMAVDMAVIIPAAFYFLVVRSRKLAPVTVVPVALLCLFLAARVIPEAERAALRPFELVAALLELGLLVWIARRARRAFGGAAGSGADPLEGLHGAARDLVPQRAAAAVLATELALFRFAFARRGSAPHVPEGMRAFSYHEKSGLGGMIAGFTMLIVCETAAMHFLVARWSGLAAWILTLSSAYAILWLIADYRASVIRPVLADGDAITFRAGLRGTVRVERPAIAGVLREAPALPGRAVLKLPLIGTPTRWVLFRDPVIVNGPYGLRRSIRAVALEPDDAAGFEAEIARDVAGATNSSSIPDGGLRYT